MWFELSTKKILKKDIFPGIKIIRQYLKISNTTTVKMFFVPWRAWPVAEFNSRRLGTIKRDANSDIDRLNLIRVISILIVPDFYSILHFLISLKIIYIHAIDKS